MNRASFFADPRVAAFVAHLGPRLLTWTVTYHTHWPHLLPANQHFHAVGVHDALASYAWPGQFTAPAPMTIGGVTYLAGATIHTYYWPETFDALTQLGLGLQAAMTGGGAHSLPWCTAILQWGLGPAFMVAAHGFLVGQGAGLDNYLLAVQHHCDLHMVDTANLTPPLLHMNSGLAKIHSLASIDGLVIFDSRVAHTLGRMINEYCTAHGIYPIPPALRIFRTLGRTPPPVIGPVGARPSNHRIFSQRRYVPHAPPVNIGWMGAQIRTSWLIDEVVTLNLGIFPGLPGLARSHYLEAALFMMGK